jgi:putative spermidine/putrescine transport system substrate-binding protein
MLYSLNRRRLLQYCAMLGGSTLLTTACRGSQSTRALDEWSQVPNLERAKEQAREFITYGMPPDWANYGEVIQTFAQRYGLTLNHIDTDMSSLEEIIKFDAEKNNPRAICADIGLLYGAIAERQGVIPPYLPERASILPQGFKGREGGWVATLTGVPALVVNVDVVKTVPQTWDDLLAPEFRGKVSAMNPARAGNAATAFLAWAYAHGGDEANMAPAIAFAKKLLPQFSSIPANTQTLEKGEVPIQINYDFNCSSAAETLRAKQIRAEVVIPGVSIYAPSALMLNKYNTAKMDVAKLFMDYVLSDEAQTAFAKFGARPIRYVLGDLKLPDAAKANWLPDDRYNQVQQVHDWTKIDAEQIGQIWRNAVLGG